MIANLTTWKFQEVAHDMDQSYGMIGSLFRSGKC